MTVHYLPFSPLSKSFPSLTHEVFPDVDPIGENGPTTSSKDLSMHIRRTGSVVRDKPQWEVDGLGSVVVGCGRFNRRNSIKSLNVAHSIFFCDSLRLGWITFAMTDRDRWQSTSIDTTQSHYFRVLVVGTRSESMTTHFFRLHTITIVHSFATTILGSDPRCDLVNTYIELHSKHRQRERRKSEAILP